MQNTSISLAILQPASAHLLSDTEVGERLEFIKNKGFEPTVLSTIHPTHENVSAGSAAERASLLAHALTLRKYTTLWAGRGGYGTTTLLPYLKNILPPILPPKNLIGYSDISFLGVSLALQYPNIRYIHGNHIFGKDFNTSHDTFEKNILIELAKGKEPQPVRFPLDYASALKNQTISVSGPAIPINLSMAECLACLPNFKLPKGAIVFLEDVNEYLYQILRKFDNLVNANFFAPASAIILGEFASCWQQKNIPVTEHEIKNYVQERVGIPVFTLSNFGHGALHFPIVCLAQVDVSLIQQKAFIQIHFKRYPNINFPVCTPYTPDPLPTTQRLHFLGIGGTGMAAVAGLVKLAGYPVTGSDTPIYPPMSTVLEKLEIQPYVGYSPENIQKAAPDVVVVANMLSKRTQTVAGNDELEYVLAHNKKFMSFPSTLRRAFLKDKNNIVVTGTHGKTTTTSLIAKTMHEMGIQPSLFVGGAARDFETGFVLANRDVFVLEGDEYDSAFFDKGPKFLHYEPKVALINNIEFDHADIYNSIEAIEQEFANLIDLVAQRHGIIVYNQSEERVQNLVQNKNHVCLMSFGYSENCAWRLLSYNSTIYGSDIQVETPWRQVISCRTQLWGEHNALNTVAAMASIHAWLILQEHKFVLTPSEEFTALVQKPLAPDTLEAMRSGVEKFSGVKRRFERVATINDIHVFDDFAHHPTAIYKTLSAFKELQAKSGLKGRIHACFEPRNATMRRNILLQPLAQSFELADFVYFGPVLQDKRIPEHERMDGYQLAQNCPKPSQYFPKHEELLNALEQNVAPGDIVVFMGPSGAFNGVIDKFVEKLQNTHTTSMHS